MTKTNTQNPIYKLITQCFPETKATGLRWIFILAALPFLVGGLWNFIEQGNLVNLLMGIGFFIAAYFGSALVRSPKSTLIQFMKRQDEIVPDRVLAAIADSTEIPAYIKEKFALHMRDKGELRRRDIVAAYEDLEAARQPSGSYERSGRHKLMDHAN